MKILIIGGGAAGLSAAVTAAQGGAQVTVWESSESFGGNGRFAEGVFAAGSQLQRRLNIDADPAVIFREAMEFAHWRSDARLTRALIDASGETVDWLCSLGVPFCRVIHHMPNQSPEVFHMTPKGPSGRVVIECLLAHCRELGVTLCTGTRASELLLRDSCVCGAKSEQGTELEADAVLIATGGMAGDPALVRELMPGFEAEKYMHLKDLYHRGDGVRLAGQAGAEPQTDLAVEGAGPVFCGRGPVGALVRSEDAIWVNLLGERFCDESVVSNFIFGQNALARQPEKRCFAVFDGRSVERLMHSGPGVMADIDAVGNGLTLLPQAIENAVEEGTLLCADSPEALAVAMGVDSKEFCRTLADYNAACRTGFDPVFDKPKRCLYPIEGKPLYAAGAGLDMITIHGGVKINAQMRVIDKDHRPIRGLYCAGIDASGIDSCDYSVMLSGHAFGFSLAGGRMAARNMMR